MLGTCNRCGKTLDIVNEGDDIHTCTPKQETVITWDADKNPEDFRAIATNLRAEGHQSRADAVDYLIDRLKIAEAPTIFTARVKEAQAELLDRALPEVCDLLAALERDNSRLTQRVKALEAEKQANLYGDY